MKTEFKIILTGAFVVMLFGLLSNAVLHSRTEDYSLGIEKGSFACTTDAQICPDGSYVGRIPPYCQFAPCLTAETLSNR
jgi:hypothetical protein